MFFLYMCLEIVLFYELFKFFNIAGLTLPTNTQPLNTRGTAQLAINLEGAFNDRGKAK